MGAGGGGGNRGAEFINETNYSNYTNSNYTWRPLISLYREAGGEYWTNNINWLSGNPCQNSWYGLNCGQMVRRQLLEEGGVSEYLIDLSGNALNGPLTTQLGSLSSVEILDMSSNSLYGSLPSQLGKLTNLKFLLFNGNSFTGTIPSEIGMLNKSRTEYINLEHNHFCGPMPPQLKDFNVLTSGNSIGTPCPAPSFSPIRSPTSMPSFSPYPTNTYRPTPTPSQYHHVEDPIWQKSGVWLGLVACVTVALLALGPILLARGFRVCPKKTGVLKKSTTKKSDIEDSHLNDSDGGGGNANITENQRSTFRVGQPNTSDAEVALKALLVAWENRLVNGPLISSLPQDADVSSQNPLHLI